MESESHSVVSDSLPPHGVHSPWNSPGQNTGVGSHFLLQGIVPTQGSTPGLPHCRWILYQLSHKGSPEDPKLFPSQRKHTRKKYVIQINGEYCALYNMVNFIKSYYPIDDILLLSFKAFLPRDFYSSNSASWTFFFHNIH